MCQCPQRASTYFFLFEVDPVAAFRKRVNALNGLLLISSTCTKLMSWHSKTVSMPSTGFYLFLPNNRSECQSSKTKCQCPQRASTYFFIDIVSKIPNRENRVNALNGLLLISSLRKVIMMTSTIKRVNALNGLLLISSITRGLLDEIASRCQCPQRASTYFFCRIAFRHESLLVSMPSTGFYLFLL